MTFVYLYDTLQVSIFRITITDERLLTAAVTKKNLHRHRPNWTTNSNKYINLSASCSGSEMRIGIDLGGTKIEVIALGDDGATLLRHRLPTPSGDYSTVLNTIVELVGYAEKEIGRKGTVGIASPGAESKVTGLIKNSNSAALNGMPLRRDIARKLGREVRMENDANCFALSEAIDGAATHAHIVFGAILGTGVGGGLVIGKQVVIGHNRIAGEWGHNPLPWADACERVSTRCYCGRAGCIEYFLSGSGLARSYPSGAMTGITAREIAAMADAGETEARECIQTYKSRLARSLAAIINVLDPDAIVLGGGLSNITELYSELTPIIAQYTFSDWIDTPIVRAVHGDSSGVRGAAWLWPTDSRDDGR
jgi:fructokinase